MPIILIPTPLRKFTGNSSRVFIEGTNIDEIINRLVSEYPDIQRSLLDASGRVRSFINIFIDQDDIRNLDNQNLFIAASSVISLIPAIAGGNLSP